MTYATRTDLRLDDALLAELTGVAPAMLPDEDVIAAALAGAGRLIDSQLRQRYPLPLTDPDGLLRDLAVALARYTLYEGCPRLIEIPKPIADARAHAITWLADLRDGRASLGTAPTDAPAAPGGAPVVRARQRTFNDDLMGRY